MSNPDRELSLDLADAKAARERAEAELDATRSRIVRLMTLDMAELDEADLDRAVETFKAARRAVAKADERVKNLLRALRG